VARRFEAEGMTVRDYLRAALKHPSLFHYPAKTVVANITGVAKRFHADGLTTGDYLTCVLKQPSLFHQSPKRIAANIRVVAKRFEAHGLTAKHYLKAAVRHPSLFYQSPDTIAGNISGVVAQFAREGLTVGDYLRAAVKQPSLFSLSPDTVAGNIRGLAKEFAAEGLTVAAYLQAAVKQPPLFYQKPTTIAQHIHVICAMYDDGIFTLPQRRHTPEYSDVDSHAHAPVIAFLLRYPILLTRSDSNLKLCRICVEMSVMPPDSRALFRPRHELERELIERLGDSDRTSPANASGADRLRQLISDGIIRSARLDG